MLAGGLPGSEDISQWKTLQSLMCPLLLCLHQMNSKYLPVVHWKQSTNNGSTITGWLVHTPHSECPSGLLSSQPDLCLGEGVWGTEPVLALHLVRYGVIEFDMCVRWINPLNVHVDLHLKQLIRTWKLQTKNQKQIYFFSPGNRAFQIRGSAWDTAFT